MSQIRAAIDGLHLPTLALAILVAVGSGVTVNGQPVDLSTGSGRAAAALGLLFIVFGAIGKWYAAHPVVTLPAALSESQIETLIARVVAASLPVYPVAVPVAPPAVPATGGSVEPPTAPLTATAGQLPGGAAVSASPVPSPVSVVPTSAWGQQNNLPGV